MFSTVDYFQMFKPAVLTADMGRSKFKQENQSKASEELQTLVNDLEWKWQKTTLCTLKHAKQQNEYYTTYSLNFLQKLFRCNPLCYH